MGRLMTQLISRQQVNRTRSAEAVFKASLSEDIEWKPFAAFPPSARLAVVVGQPLEPGPYTIRVKAPRGVKHRHPEDRIYTVISVVLYIGHGDEFDADRDSIIEWRYFDLEAQLYSAVLTPPVNGRIPVPEGPGLGFDPGPNVIRGYL